MNGKTVKKVLIGIVVVLLIGGLAYLLIEYLSLKNKLEDPIYLTNLQQEQQSLTKEKIISRLSSIYLLPDEINPQIAQITDVKNLKKENPSFYKNAQDGDTLVLYSELAIIYRDSINKIINVAPVVDEEGEVSSTK